MSKEFNDTGNCIPERHYMADVSDKLEPILALIEKGKYFTIKAPRQYGKTTIQDLLWRRLQEKEGYEAINISFEKIDHDCFRSTAAFTDAFLLQLADYAEDTEDHELEAALEKHEGIGDFPRLSRFITDLTRDRKIVLMIEDLARPQISREGPGAALPLPGCPGAGQRVSGELRFQQGRVAQGSVGAYPGAREGDIRGLGVVSVCSQGCAGWRR